MSKFENLYPKWNELGKQGKGYAEIGRATGASRATVEYYFKKIANNPLPVKKSPYTRFYSEWIRLYNQENWTCRMISQKYKVSEQTVIKAIKKRGITVNQKKSAGKRWEHNTRLKYTKFVPEWKALYGKSMSYNAIGQKYKVPASTVRTYLKAFA